MKKCPKCGRYMTSSYESVFGGIKQLWTCVCGYSTKLEKTSVSNKIKDFDLRSIQNTTNIN